MSEPTVDLGRLRVVVFGVMAYGNVGDELETAPLFYKLHEWGIKAVDVVLSPWSVAMCDLRNVQCPTTGAPYLSPPYARSVYKKFPRVNYDVAIYAPGPSCKEERLEAAYLRGIDVVVFGTSVREPNRSWRKSIGQRIRRLPQLVRSLTSGRAVTRCYIVREPASEEYLKARLRAESQRPAPQIAMSGDIGFSSGPYLDHDLVDSYRQTFKTTLPSRYCIFFPRAASEDGDVYLQRNRFSAGFEVRDRNQKNTWTLVDPVVIATTDRAIDHEMMDRYRSAFPDVPQVYCDRVEQLWALVDGARCVYTTRYHPGVMALIVDTPLVVLPHLRHPLKMTGLGLVKEGLANGKYQKNNEAGWNLLRSTLEDIAIHRIQGL